MNREIHVRICESLRGQFPRATRLLYNSLCHVLPSGFVTVASNPKVDCSWEMWTMLRRDAVTDICSLFGGDALVQDGRH